MSDIIKQYFANKSIDLKTFGAKLAKLLHESPEKTWQGKVTLMGILQDPSETSFAVYVANLPSKYKGKKNSDDCAAAFTTLMVEFRYHLYDSERSKEFLVCFDEIKQRFQAQAESEAVKQANDTPIAKRSRRHFADQSAGDSKDEGNQDSPGKQGSGLIT